MSGIQNNRLNADLLARQAGERPVDRGGRPWKETARSRLGNIQVQ